MGSRGWDCSSRALVPGAIANRVDGYLWLVPFADVFVCPGFVLALTGAVLVGSSLRYVLPLGVTFGVGIFYPWSPTQPTSCRA